MKKKHNAVMPSRIREFFARKNARSEFIRYFLIGILFSMMIFLVILFSFTPGLPGFDRLERIYDEQTLSTIIYSDDGEVLQITSNPSQGRRMWLGYNEIPKVMIDAVIAAEDTRFYHHWGVSLPDIARAMVKNVLHFGIAQGASTITQQLARDQWLTRKQTIFRKLQEALLAVKIEHTYSKPEILELFLNRMFFGSNYYGIEAASRGYFGKPATDMTVGEAALLAGILQAPSRYNPRLHPEAATTRRNIVLGMMANAGVITREQAREERDTPIELASMTGREFGKAPFFVDYVYDQLLRRYDQAALDSLGLKVYTTLDSRLQEIAENALNRQLDTIQREYADKLRYRRPAGISNAAAARDSLARTQVQGALVAIDVRTGAVLAMVGGRNYDRSNQFNRATQAIRQPGSAFKPFVYTAALDNGWHMNDTVIDSYFAIPAGDGKMWAPDNFDGTFSGRPMTLLYALQHSINSVAVKLVNDPSIRSVGIPSVIKYARRMGITTSLPSYPSIALGSAGVRLIDITSSYTVYPNLGIRTEPFTIRTITDKNDNQKLQIREGQKSEALRREVASLMITMLKSVNRGGTAAGVIARRGLGDRPSGGKTGTANDFKDAWYIGFTPYICCGVWVGFDSEETKLSRQYGTGAGAAAPVWADFIFEASEVMGYPKTDFQLASHLVAVKMCSETHLRATESCPSVYVDYFPKNAVPDKFCGKHGAGGEETNAGARSFSHSETENSQGRGF